MITKTDETREQAYLDVMYGLYVETYLINLKDKQRDSIIKRMKRYDYIEDVDYTYQSFIDLIKLKNWYEILWQQIQIEFDIETYGNSGVKLYI